jgi:hypothetical protein
MMIAQASAQDAMTAKFAHIAGRATLPQSGAKLSDEDRVALLVLFSLQRDGRNP